MRLNTVGATQKGSSYPGYNFKCMEVKGPWLIEKSMHCQDAIFNCEPSGVGDSVVCATDKTYNSS